MNLSIGPQDIVLDVGSGGKPHPRANVLCEPYIDSTQDRTGLVFDQQGKDVVLGDIQCLPFRDKAFDYVICCHVLEHLPRPWEAMRELERVGRAGYIEVPSELSEVLADNPAHESVVRTTGDRLVFERKPRYPHQPHIQAQLRSVARRACWRRLLSYDEFFVRYHWRQHVEFEIVGGVSTYDDCRHIGNTAMQGIERRESWSRRVLRRHVLRFVSSLVYPDRASYKLDDLVCCPLCRGRLAFGTVSATCSACGAGYPRRSDGIRVLLRPDRI
jgi:SAM-dependent methyltransferase/uncharacterized protein YbaR (Trm112 family)